MSFAFTLEKPHDDVAVPCSFNGWQFNHVRLVMIEAGVLDGDGFAQALQHPDLPVTEQTLRGNRFAYNEGHVTAGEAAFIAGRLRQAVEADVIWELLSFFDDAPETDEVVAWVNEFAAFNETAAARDGYWIC
jgi:hypothetical protein